MEIELVLVAMQRAHPLNTWEFFPDGFKHFADLHPKKFKKSLTERCHVILGLGFPDTWHVRVMVDPFLTTN